MELRQRLSQRCTIKPGPAAHFPRVRKAPPPNPRKVTPEQAEFMRAMYSLGGLHYRLLGEMFEIAPGCAHHCVTYRGAYRRDKQETAA